MVDIFWDSYYSHRIFNYKQNHSVSEREGGERWKETTSRMEKNVTACSKVGCQCFVDILGQRDWSATKEWRRHTLVEIWLVIKLVGMTFKCAHLRNALCGFLFSDIQNKLFEDVSWVFYWNSHAWANAE